jgi:hypothetical protein
VPAGGSGRRRRSPSLPSAMAPGWRQKRSQIDGPLPSALCGALDLERAGGHAPDEVRRGSGGRERRSSRCWIVVERMGPAAAERARALGGHDRFGSLFRRNSLWRPAHPLAGQCESAFTVSRSPTRMSIKGYCQGRGGGPCRPAFLKRRNKAADLSGPVLGLAGPGRRPLQRSVTSPLSAAQRRPRGPCAASATLLSRTTKRGSDSARVGVFAGQQLRAWPVAARLAEFVHGLVHGGQRRDRCARPRPGRRSRPARRRAAPPARPCAAPAAAPKAIWSLAANSGVKRRLPAEQAAAPPGGRSSSK